ncbi:MAG: hypothetical protein M3422_20015 [Actinomycetota bacterium]|nr:hypothetical protein [Actinomycetota bacterium]
MAELRDRGQMVTSRRAPALRNQSIGVGLMAVRARAAVKRALSGQTLTERDTAELENVKDVLSRAADVLLHGSSSRPAPGGRQLTSIGLALSSITPPRDDLDHKAAAKVVATLVADIDKLLAGTIPDNGTGLNDFLTGLLRTADRDTAQSGEVLVRHDL